MPAPYTTRNAKKHHSSTKPLEDLEPWTPRLFRDQWLSLVVVEVYVLSESACDGDVLPLRGKKSICTPCIVLIAAPANAISFAVKETSMWVAWDAG